MTLASLPNEPNYIPAMPDLLTIWLGAQVVGFVFKPILEELARDVAGDWSKDFCSQAWKSVFKGKDVWTRAAGKALAQFLIEFRTELISAGVAEDECQDYSDDLQTLVSLPAVRETLGEVVTNPQASLNYPLLSQLWNEHGLRLLPSEFRWRALANRYHSSARTIAREFPEIQRLLDSKNLQRIADTVEQAAPLPAGFDLVRFAEGMREKYRRLRLESMDVTGVYYRELELWRVFIPQHLRECQEYLPQVFELPKEHLRRLRESGELDVRARSLDDTEQLRLRYIEQSPRNILELVDDPDSRLLVILGDPGSGKSSLLQALVVRWAEAPPADLPAIDLPLLVELRLYAQARQKQDGVRTFMEFFHHGPGMPGRLDQHELKRWLDQGRARVFFDGLDEVFDPQLREEIVTAIHAFSNDFPKVRLVVTSRPIGYKGETLRHAGFRHFMLEELDDDQIAAFLTKWYNDTYNPASQGQERDEKLARLSRAIQNSRPIRELAGNPLLLTMMAILNRNQDLPRDRATLYQECSRLLLFQWKVEEALRADPDLSADATAIGLEEKRTILRRLAREMQTGPEGLAGNIIAEERLEAIVVDCIRPVIDRGPLAVARALIRQLRERNFILCFVGGKSYAFVHRTFLEYFCADDLRTQFDHEKSIDLDHLKNAVYGAHWPDERWHEVLCLVAGMIHPTAVAEIILHLLAQKDSGQTCRHIFLAARCVGEVRRGGDVGAASAAACGGLQGLVQFDLNYYYEFWDPEEDRVREIRTKAVSLCASVWSGQPATREWLKMRVQEDEDARVRRAAVRELARGWKDASETLPWLKALAQKDENSDVRQAALQELASGWKDDPELLPILKNHAKEDEDESVRSTAVQELARGWKDDPETLPILKVRAQEDENPRVRQEAVRELARGWKDDSEVLLILKNRAKQDEDWFVRYAAVEELTRGWMIAPGLLPIFKNLAKEDESASVRSGAVQSLALGWKGDSEVLSILKTSAQQDESGVVRSSAVWALRRGWKDDPETLQILKSRAQHDKDQNVRQAAVQALSRGWKNNSEVQSFLRDLKMQGAQ